MAFEAIEVQGGARSPQELMELFAAGVHAADVDGLVRLYEPDAVFESAPGVVARGHGEIRGALEQMLSLGPRLQVTPVQVLVAGDVALVVNEWTMTGTAPDGAVVERGGKSADVVRRQPDGSWLVLVDRP
ncbi:MAG TPA: SgcJ/EcaC family oxidoreductase [Acidimicrobiales bacterium]|jgi:uncharacterized protein (TIGR02246 family)|nr:SgcJ/EcaC family oxidoreductase [Acidimicrobiales bacterium]